MKRNVYSGSLPDYSSSMLRYLLMCVNISGSNARTALSPVTPRVVTWDDANENVVCRIIWSAHHPFQTLCYWIDIRYINRCPVAPTKPVGGRLHKNPICWQNMCNPLGQEAPATSPFTYNGPRLRFETACITVCTRENSLVFPCCGQPVPKQASYMRGCSLVPRQTHPASIILHSLDHIPWY